MSYLLTILILVLFFAFFKVSKDSDGTIKIVHRGMLRSGPSKPFQLFQVKNILRLLTFVFIILELVVLLNTVSPIQTLLKIRAAQLIPNKFNPIARFVANMDWKTNTITLDASMSKAYNDKIVNYIWRIDNGTSLVGSQSLVHQFTNPGYYLIQLSVVDQDNQSDTATCQLLIPPTELERIATKEQSSITTNNTVAEISYDWAPVGTFFNYSKMKQGERSYANLKSQYIESGCGYSNASYNTARNEYSDFFQDRRVQAALADLIQGVIMGVVAFPLAYLVLARFIKRIMSKESSV